MRGSSIPSLLLLLALFPVSTNAWLSAPFKRKHAVSTTRRKQHLGPQRGIPSNIKSHRLTTTRQVVSHSGGGADGENQGRSADPNRLRQISVSVVLVAAFLNLLGFTMAGPITPALGQHFQLDVGASFGSLTSAYPVGMLVGLFLWPQLSDKIGRKPVICASLCGSGVGLAAQAFCIQRDLSLGMFLLTRVLTGSFAGSSPVAKAYLADIGQTDGRLPKYLAWRDAAATLAFIIGPVLGGLMYDLRRRTLGLAKETAKSELLRTTGSLAFVIGVSAATSLAAAGLVALFVTEHTVARPVSQENVKQSSDDNNDTTTTISCPLGNQLWAGVATVCVVSFLFNFGDSTFHAFFSAVLRDRAALDTRAIGLAYTALACVSLTVSSTLASPSLQRFGPVATCATGLTAVGAGLLGLGASCFSAISTTIGPVMLAATLYYSGVPLYGPAIPTMLLQCVPPKRRGAVMGLDGAINTLARAISPLLMGEVYRQFGPGAAFGTAGLAVLGAVLTTLGRRLVVLNQRGAAAAA